MKKNFLKLLSILFIGSIGITASAQGLWKTTGLEAPIPVSTETGFGIPGLTCMHSDNTVIDIPTLKGVMGRADAAPVSVTYNAVTYDNLGILQGSLNGMYYAFRPTAVGNYTIDLALKMSANKTFFVNELTATCPDEADLAALTTINATGAIIYGDPTNVALPSVFDTYTNTTTTWNGTVVIVPTAAGTQYMVVSFPVTANKTYIVGVNGSKLQLRGVNYHLTTGVSESKANEIGISPNPASGSVNVNLEEATEIAIYNTTGSLVKQQLVSASDNTVDISALAPGVYFVKDLNSISTQKLIVK